MRCKQRWFNAAGSPLRSLCHRGTRTGVNSVPRVSERSARGHTCLWVGSRSSWSVRCVWKGGVRGQQCWLGVMPASVRVRVVGGSVFVDDFRTPSWLGIVRQVWGSRRGREWDLLHAVVWGGAGGVSGAGSPFLEDTGKRWGPWHMEL